MHAPDGNFEGFGNELACAQLERNPTIAVWMGTALWHNFALWFPHSLGDFSKQAQGIRNLCDRNLKSKELSSISISAGSPDFSKQPSFSEILTVWSFCGFVGSTATWRMRHLEFYSCFSLKLRKKNARKWRHFNKIFLA